MPGPAWIVLPTYCEADNVERMVRALRAVAPRDARVLIVDDGRVENWAVWRRAASRAACVSARAVLRVPVRDLTSGCKCFRAEALETIGFRTARARGYAFQVELTYRALQAGLRVTELPIAFRERREGRSKMTAAVALEAVWRIPALRLRPARVRAR